MLERHVGDVLAKDVLLVGLSMIEKGKFIEIIFFVDGKDFQQLVLVAQTALLIVTHILIYTTI